MQIYKYKIKEIIGDKGITLEQGVTLNELIYPHLIKEEAVDIDFDGVLILTSVFMNGAFGYLLKDINKNSLLKLLFLSNINKTHLYLFGLTIANSHRYYQLPPNKRKEIDELLREVGESI